MSRYVAQTWNSITKPELYLHEKGYFTVKFQSIKDTREVLYAGPYTINYRSLNIKPSTPDFDLMKNSPQEIFLWLKLSKLPMNYWGINSLNQIASSISSPVYADEYTTKQMSVSFTCMFGEVNVTKPFPNKIKMLDPNEKSFMQPVTYE